MGDVRVRSAVYSGPLGGEEAHAELGGVTTTVSPGKATCLDTSSPTSRLLSRVEGHAVRAGLESTDVVKQARALLNTHDSTRRLIERKRFEEGYAGSSSEATEYLVEMCVMTVGVDCLSVEPFEDEKFKAWRILFGAVVKPSVYSFFACVQPKYAVSDGVPARATLVSDLQGGSAA
jgi:kynurenine formamidase